ncbi:MAG: hypothetical protein KAQ69_11785 [Spirochaetales bacterium]|nr:hypothetical protein [Spirochaetales bacterium]
MKIIHISCTVLAEKLNIKEIITIDSDYYMYQTLKKEMIVNVFTYG